MWNARVRTALLLVLIILCLLMGWMVLAIVMSVVAIIVATAVLTCAKERRPGESWLAWFWRIIPEAELRRAGAGDNTTGVLVSCGHRGWVLDTYNTAPGDTAYCSHKRWGPAEEVEVMEVGVIVYDTDCAIIRL